MQMYSIYMVYLCTGNDSAQKFEYVRNRRKFIVAYFIMDRTPLRRDLAISTFALTHFHARDWNDKVYSKYISEL